MAVHLIKEADDKYGGYSSDIKPTIGIENGTIFVEIDTGAKFIWFDGTWEDDLTMIYMIKKAME